MDLAKSACELRLVEGLMEARHLPVSFRYRTGRSGDKKKRLGSLQQNVGDLKCRIAIQSNVKNRTIKSLRPSASRASATRPNGPTASPPRLLIRSSSSMARSASSSTRSNLRPANGRFGSQKLSGDLVAHYCPRPATGKQSRIRCHRDEAFAQRSRVKDAVWTFRGCRCRSLAGRVRVRS